MLNSGPPELPGLIATSVWMNGTRFSCGRSRPFALTMPAVIVFSRPNGLPMATTHSPTLSLSGSPIDDARQLLRVDLQQRDVGALVGADDLGDEFALVGQPHGHFGRFVDDVRVGDDVAVGREDEARTRSTASRIRAAGRRAAGRAGIWPKRRKNS